MRKPVLLTVIALGISTALAAPPTTPRVQAPGPTAHLEDERNTIDVFEAAGPATVFVTQNQLVRDLWTRQTSEVPAGSGTGFLWDTQGHVVTNYHVVDGGRSFKVTLHDGQAYDARVVGGEPRKDIAVLQIDAPASALQPLPLPPEGTELHVGQKAIAIGNPFGLDHTLTTGVVSAIGRELAGYGGVTIRDMIQTDASINPGNSGGPLLDSRGQLIGMNTAIFSQSGSSAGIGFAVPVSTIRRVVPQLIAYGQVKQVGLGVSLVSDAIARRAGVDGVAIEQVRAESPAAAAGLRGLQQDPRGARLGDVIIGVDDAEIHSYDDLYNALFDRKEGQEVKVRVRRGAGEVVVRVVLTLLD